ncbi:ATP synthase subunit beta, chloroplastic [Quillaja saponaria]|uniref:ATP synthase subunit beta, chloroplastic n=1 Tax=Quillaja saponaria TaxID=32244 RepID=A0AAD7KLE5_QUISA|nr:ATP synthase subunit beta, chloroplastic [Quillaja saponaria]
MGAGHARSRYLNRKEGDAEGRASDWSEVVTRISRGPERRSVFYPVCGMSAVPESRLSPTRELSRYKANYRLAHPIFPIRQFRSMISSFMDVDKIPFHLAATVGWHSLKVNWASVQTRKGLTVAYLGTQRPRKGVRKRTANARGA